MVTSIEFLSELERELLKADPMNRHKIVLGYAAHMEAREIAIRAEELESLAVSDSEWIGVNLRTRLSLLKNPPIYNMAGNSEILGEV